MPAGAEEPVVDTSLAVPLLVPSHSAHALVVAWWRGRTLALSGHAAVETFSVLTRLPGDLRLAPADARLLIERRFAAPVLMKPAGQRRVHQALADLDIAGGAVYDAIVALAAKDHRIRLATRDGRAQATYEAVGVEVEVVA